MSKKNCQKRDREVPYESEENFEFTCYDPSQPQFSEDVDIYDLLMRVLSEREFVCIDRIVIKGCSAAEVAREFGVTKQAINQCKQRALRKVKQTLNK